MQIHVVESDEQFDALRESWQCLTRGNPFRSWAWLRSWWDCYRDSRQLLLLTVRDERGQLVGIAPWCRETSATSGQIIRFLGSGEVCTDYLGLLTTSEHELAVTEAMADWLSSNATAWDLLELSGASASDRSLQHLVERLQERGHPAHSRPGLRCWRINLPDSWESYLESLSKSHRKQMRRVERRSIETGRAVMRSVESPRELNEALEIFERLHQSRRHSLGEDGCFASTAFARFLRTVSVRLLECGMLQLRWLELDGQSVAIDFDLAGGGVTYAYQSGIDPAALEEEPGRILNVLLLKQAIQDRQQGFDFLRGDEPYKAHWRAEPVPMIEYRVAGKRPLAQIRHSAWLAATTVKDWMKGSNLSAPDTCQH